MIRNFTKQFSFTALLLILNTSGIWAQKSDHLIMNLDFKDSTVFIHATYHSDSKLESDSIYFLLNPELELDTIISSGLKSYQISEKTGIPLPFYLLEFSDQTNFTAGLDVEFTYKINLSQQNHMKSNWIELSVDKLWFPNLNNLNNKFTYEVSISNFPNDYYLITHTDASVTIDMNSIYIVKATPWFEVLILAGKNMKEWKFNENITIIGSEAIPDSTVNTIGTKVKNSIDFLNGYFGTSDSITNFKVVLRNTKKAELGYQFNRRNMIITGIDFNDYANLSHEIAHFWWSKANFIEEPWMNESFANYSMYLVLEKYNFEDYKRIVERNRKTAKDAIPVVDATLFAPDSYNSYYIKGSILLLSLQEKIGPKLMRQLLSTCINENIRTTARFLEELEKLTNKEQRSYFENLLKS